MGLNSYGRNGASAFITRAKAASPRSPIRFPGHKGCESDLSNIRGHITLFFIDSVEQIEGIDQHMTGTAGGVADFYFFGDLIIR